MDYRGLIFLALQFIPQVARWETLRNQAKQPEIGRLLDEALIAIEDFNPSLKNIMDKRFARTQIEPSRLGQLIDFISKIGFTSEDKAKDVLGEVYEYFLGQFATAEGKKGGQFYTPGSVVRVLVAMLSPHKGRIYDPCCGSGGMLDALVAVLTAVSDASVGTNEGTKRER